MAQFDRNNCHNELQTLLASRKKVSMLKQINKTYSYKFYQSKINAIRNFGYIAFYITNYTRELKQINRL